MCSTSSLSDKHTRTQQIQVLLKGRARHPGGHEVYLQYLEHLRLKLFPVPEQVSRVGGLNGELCMFVWSLALVRRELVARADEFIHP